MVRRAPKVSRKQFDQAKSGFEWVRAMLHC
jgi:hypothetical protein